MSGLRSVRHARIFLLKCYGRKRRVFLATLITMIMPLASRAQISPGPLAKSHRQLEGMRACTACHELGKQLSDAKCLVCHVSIKTRIEKQRGFHAFAVGTQKEKCVTCHKEHGGEDFALIYWENGEANFDHTKTGFALVGKHRALQCRDCHQPKFIRDDFGGDKNVRKAKTFLGLQQTCVSCHADEHRGQLGQDCQRCHDSQAWKPAPQFSHDRTKYPLTGRHQQVACGQCHHEQTAPEKVGNEKIAAFVQFTGLTFNNCMPCHRDPHRGGFGENCARCHSTTGWKSVPRNRFNHDLTAFPLRGKHVSVSCEKCHAGSNFKKALAHQFCKDCHADAHAGQFADRNDRGACEACHTVEGFMPSTFTLAKHAQTKFALAGGHLATPCIACHTRQSTPLRFDSFSMKRDGAGTLRFAFNDRRCQVCHQDVHRGQFTARLATAGCEGCHRLESWHQTAFNHDLANFPLKGRHQQVACTKCHKTETASGETFVRYRPLKSACNDCHNDVHRGQFKENMVTHCERCHEPAAWNQLLFVHNRDSSYKLDGAHSKVACEKCHFPLKLKDATQVVVYKPLRKECAACHR